MTKPKGVFKKRKNVFNPKLQKLVGQVIQNEVRLSPGESMERRSDIATSSPEPSKCLSSSKGSSGDKLKGKVGYDDFEKDNTDVMDLVNLKNLFEFFQVFANCKKCHTPIKMNVSDRNGLSVKICISCPNCNDFYEFSNSKTLNFLNEDEGVAGERTYVEDVNIRLVYALRGIGKGLEGGKTFCGLMNMSPPPSKFTKYTNILSSATERVAKRSMTASIQQAIQDSQSSDLAVGFDGSWQKRGHTSQNGIVSVTSVETGRVLDIEIMSKYCICPRRLQNSHLNSCIANYQGSSGGMEVEGVKRIYKRSSESGIARYLEYLGDGDCKAFEQVKNLHPYGSDVQLKKIECVGHVQKRMGKRLKTLKSKLGSEKLDDNKTIGGQKRLSDPAILKIQNYYGQAIRNNTNNLEGMRKAIWAIYFHIASTDDEPSHGLCPNNDDTWCKFHKSVKNNEKYIHGSHFHLPKAIMLKIKPIFKDLSENLLLEKCLKGKTQNTNESLNNVLWCRIPKTTFVQIKTLKFGVYEGVATFNDGNISRCKILQEIGIQPGFNCVQAMMGQDMLRIKRSERQLKEATKEARQKKSLARKRLEERFEEDEGGPSYLAGGF